MNPTLRKGDIVTVAAEITSDPHDFDGSPKVKVRIEPYHEIFVLAADVTVVRPDFRVGDRVTWSTADGADSFTGDVLSVAQDHLWVDLGSGHYATVWAGKAIRIDPEPVQDEEAA